MDNLDIAIIGAGPAGLMAATELAGAGRRVAVFEAMPSAGRKFLLAGRGGINLTHSEPLADFLGRYGDRAEVFARALARFSPDDLRAFVHGLGVETFVGTSGRVFPSCLKASVLLRAWLRRLGEAGVALHTRHRWQGWVEDGAEAGAQRFVRGDGSTVAVRAAATVLALGGASWPRTGSDGGWVPALAARGVAVAPFRPANCGFEVAWSEVFRQRYQGKPLKRIALSFAGRKVEGELMLTDYGVEGGVVYTLSAALRDAIERDGRARLLVDLKPALSVEEVRERLERPRGGYSLSNHLRKTAALPGPSFSLLRESTTGEEFRSPAVLAARIKALPLELTAPRPLDRAISSAGGVRFDEVTDGLMLKRLPGVFVAGEMLDWEAPTGGYLLQGCFSTGVLAADGVRAWLAAP